MKQKGFAPLIIILILAMVAVVGYFGFKYQQLSHQTAQLDQFNTSPSPSAILDTSNWKTYSSQQYGLSFKYPQNWFYNDYVGEKVISGDQPQPVTFIFNKSSSEAVTIGDINRVEFNFVYFRPSNDPQKFINDQITNNHYQNPKIEKVNNKYILKYSDRTAEIAFMINPTTNEVIEMTTTVLNETTISNWSDYFNQILSTFKFLGQNSATKNSNRITYKSSAYGYQITYPENSDNLLKRIPSLSKDDNSDFAIALQGPTSTNDPFPDKAHIEVRILPNPSNLSLEQLGNNTYATDAPAPYDLGWQKTTFAGMNAITTTYHSPGDGGTLHIYQFTKNGKVFSIWWESSSGGIDYQNSAIQIVNSFKFIN